MRGLLLAAQGFIVAFHEFLQREVEGSAERHELPHVHPIVPLLTLSDEGLRPL